ncbi:MAG TPA: hypothetical protein VGH19_23630 [Verrucomicrobiae bacterium]
MPLRRILALLALCAGVVGASAAEDPLSGWKTGVKISAASGETNRHVIHSYFNTCPESPDGKWVLYYTSTVANGQKGDICIRNRQSGEEKVLVRNVNTEDAHRAACQQWVAKGKKVAFHDERNGEWIVAVVDIETGVEKIIARNRLSSWSQPYADVVPVYGLHWDINGYQNLELVDVNTGEAKEVLKIEAVKEKYGDWIKKKFGEKTVSIFFPELSPDLKRVFFKMAAPGNGNPRSGGASQREGMICYDLAEKKFLFVSEVWGHPAWAPDSKTIVEVRNMMIDSDTGKSRTIPGLPSWGSGHPSSSPDAKLIVTDVTMDKLKGPANEWGIVVMDARGTNHAVINQVDGSKGATSWRRSHPHPIFSADNKRIYFNVNNGKWTQLMVAERGEK